MHARRRRLLLLGLHLAMSPRLFAQDATQRDTSHRTTMIADVEYVAFNGDFDPWRLASVSLGRRTVFGAVIGRVNYANRFHTDGAQIEADAYPRFGDRVYGYLNVGYSAAGIFPRWRSGAEVFVNLPGAFEASVGYRQLRYGGSTPVTLYTGAVGKYAGNYWLSVRPYVHPEAAGTSTSATVVARRYFEDANAYLGARVGFGTIPNDRLDPTELARTSSFSTDIHGQYRLAQRTFARWTVGFERERLAAGLDRRRLDVTAGVRVDF
jgi:YaiO family outer membrane protein